MKETKTMKKKPVAAPLNHRFITNAFWSGALAAILACVITAVLAICVAYVQRQDDTIKAYQDSTFEAMEEVIEVRKLYEAALKAPTYSVNVVAPKPAPKRKLLQIASNSCGR
jgi:hypothetical protein